MTVLTVTRARIAGRFEAALASISAAAQEELEHTERRRALAASQRAESERRMRENSRRARAALRRRVRTALRGVRSLLALTELPELLAMARMVETQPPFLDSNDIPKDGFQYYSAWDEQEQVVVLLYPHLVLVHFGGPEAQYEGRLEFRLDQTDAEVLGLLKEIASLSKRPPLESARVFDQPGDNGDLGALAFQVLVEAARPRRLETYCMQALEMLPRD